MSVLTSICVLPDGQKIAADKGFIHVKLFDQQYKILDLCDISPYPYKMCQITNNTVGVTVNDDTNNVHEVQFIEIRDRKLVKRRAVVLLHACIGISHRQGDLYIYVTSGTALYKYMLSGVLICKLYENTSGSNTVHSCAVNPTGDIIYITNYTESRLLTLNRDGDVLFSFNDPELQSPSDVHVTHGGQVLICGHDSNTIIQVDCEGRQKLTTLATSNSKLMLPVSACYNKQTSSIIVGHRDNIKILVIKVV